jgi:hypothetical protein
MNEGNKKTVKETYNRGIVGYIHKGIGIIFIHLHRDICSLKRSPAFTVQ